MTTLSTILFLAITAVAVYLSLGKGFFSNLFSTMTESSESWTREELLGQLRREYGDGIQPLTTAEAQRFAGIDAEEYEKEWDNYHTNILQGMFWGGATSEQMDAYREEYLDKPQTYSVDKDIT